MWIGPAKPRLLKFYRPPIRSTRFWLKSLGAARSHPIMYGSLTRSTARPILFTVSLLLRVDCADAARHCNAGRHLRPDPQRFIYGVARAGRISEQPPSARLKPRQTGGGVAWRRILRPEKSQWIFSPLQSDQCAVHERAPFRRGGA